MAWLNDVVIELEGEVSTSNHDAIRTIMRETIEDRCLTCPACASAWKRFDNKGDRNGYVGECEVEYTCGSKGAVRLNAHTKPQRVNWNVDQSITCADLVMRRQRQQIERLQQQANLDFESPEARKLREIDNIVHMTNEQVDV